MARMQDWLTSLTSPDLFGAVRLFLNSALSDFVYSQSGTADPLETPAHAFAFDCYVWLTLTHPAMPPPKLYRFSHGATIWAGLLRILAGRVTVAGVDSSFVTPEFVRANLERLLPVNPDRPEPRRRRDRRRVASARLAAPAQRSGHVSLQCSNLDGGGRPRQQQDLDRLSGRRFARGALCPDCARAVLSERDLNGSLSVRLCFFACISWGMPMLLSLCPALYTVGALSPDVESANEKRKGRGGGKRESKNAVSHKQSVSGLKQFEMPYRVDLAHRISVSTGRSRLGGQVAPRRPFAFHSLLLHPVTRCSTETKSGDDAECLSPWTYARDDPDRTKAGDRVAPRTRRPARRALV